MTEFLDFVSMRTLASILTSKEMDMTLSQTYRTALIAIAGFFLTAEFHRGAIAQSNSPQGVRNSVLVHGAFADGSSWTKVIPLLQAKGSEFIDQAAEREPLPCPTG